MFHPNAFLQPEDHTPNTGSTPGGPPVPGPGPRTSGGTELSLRVSQSKSDPRSDPQAGSQSCRFSAVCQALDRSQLLLGQRPAFL